MRCGVKNSVRLMRIENCRDSFPIADVRDHGHEEDVGEIGPQLVEDVEDRVLAVSEEHHARGCESRNLSAKLASNRPTGACDEDCFARRELCDRGQVRLHGLATKEVLNLHFAKTRSIGLRRNQLWKTGNGESWYPAIESSPYYLPDHVSAR